MYATPHVQKRGSIERERISEVEENTLLQRNSHLWATEWELLQASRSTGGVRSGQSQRFLNGLGEQDPCSEVAKCLVDGLYYLRNISLARDVNPDRWPSVSGTPAHASAPCGHIGQVERPFSSMQNTR